MKATILSEAVSDIERCENTSQLKKVKKKYLGVGGILTREFLSIASLSKELRRVQSKVVLQMQESFNSAAKRKEEQLNDGSKR